MPQGVLVYLEHRQGSIKKPSREALGCGRLCADATSQELVAVAVGSGVESLAGEAGKAGADRVLLVDDPALAENSIAGHGKAVAEAARKMAPALILFPATVEGKDVAAWVAAALDTGLATDCIAIEAKDGSFLARRPVYAGKAILTVKPTKLPFVASLRPNVFAVSARNGGGAAEKVAFEGTGAGRVRTTEHIAAAEGKIELAEASIVVSGGRGLKGPENFSLIEELARELGAAVGASRAVVDAGWRPHEEQVGQTGKTVAPQLYFACGISGAIQHLAGMSTSRTIVAINNDESAPIFNVATYGLVGDALEVLPALTAAIREAKNG
jgi:electron transfer flavoprotein alpha subunit